MSQNPTRSPQNLWHNRAKKALRITVQAGKKAIYSVGKLSRKYSSPHILLFTDSRGINIHGHNDYKHYSTRLCARYYVDSYLNPDKWTTLLDFLNLYRKISHRNYQFIIVHAGIVDASPRHRTTLLESIYPMKKDIFDDVFGEAEIQAYMNGEMGFEYEGDKTNNMYSIEMAREKLLPHFQKIPNLIWIGSNKIVPGWRGNYWKDRPKNISVIEEYAKLFVDALTRSINLLEWSLDEVKQKTFDNIHPNSYGSDEIYDKLIYFIENQST